MNNWSLKLVAPLMGSLAALSSVGAFAFTIEDAYVGRGYNYYAPAPVLSAPAVAPAFLAPATTCIAPQVDTQVSSTPTTISIPATRTVTTTTTITPNAPAPAPVVSCGLAASPCPALQGGSRAYLDPYFSGHYSSRRYKKMRLKELQYGYGQGYGYGANGYAQPYAAGAYRSPAWY